MKRYIQIEDTETFKSEIRKLLREELNAWQNSNNNQANNELILLSRKDVMQLLGISSTKLWQMVKNFEIKYSRIGRKLVFRRNDILEMINNQ